MKHNPGTYAPERVGRGYRMTITCTCGETATANGITGLRARHAAEAAHARHAVAAAA